MEVTSISDVNMICPDCGSYNLAREGGCVICMDCGWSPCK